MLETYLFFASFQLLASFICAYLCFKISRLNQTPTLTFMLLAVAFSLRILSQLHGFMYVADVVDFYANFSTKLIIGSNAFAAITSGVFLVAFFRIYHGLRAKGIK